MIIDLKHRITKESIAYFECCDDDLKIINEKFNYAIEFQIEKQLYDSLESLNYTIYWLSDPIFSDGNISESTLQKMLLASRKYFVIFPSLEMDDEMLEKFYSDRLFGLNEPNKELKKVDYKERHFKINNLNLYIDGRLVDISASILKEEIVYSV